MVSRAVSYTPTEGFHTHERYELAAKGSNDGVWDWDLRTNTVYFCDRWKEMIGLLKEEAMETIEDWLGRVHADYVQLVRTEIDSHLAGMLPRFESEYQIQCADGNYQWMLARGIAQRDENGHPIRMTGFQTDISLRKMHEEQLAHAALHDSLTGLANRVLFMDRLERLLKKTTRSDLPSGAVLFLDLDRFKLVNDNLGHMVGDQFLCSVSERLKSAVRPGDIVARLGGDEFVILLEEIKTIKEASVAANRLIDVFKKPFFVNGKELSMTASIGIALVVSDYPTTDVILRNADLAMYEAKAQGRNQCIIFKQE